MFTHCWNLVNNLIHNANVCHIRFLCMPSINPSTIYTTYMYICQLSISETNQLPFPWRFHTKTEKWRKNRRERRLSVDSWVDAVGRSLLARQYQTGPVCTALHQSSPSQHSCQTPTMHHSYSTISDQSLRTDLGTDSGPRPVHCRLTRCRSIFADRHRSNTTNN